MKLVIIEGLGKKDTIKKYLGDDYEVVATKGHVRDLPQKSLAVNPKNNFEVQYEIMPDKKDIVKMLKEKSSKADSIYLATDPDREGEAISWHLCSILDLNPNDPIRIQFNEITKNAITKGLENPRAIDLNLVNAQQTRRIIDRLVGYGVSPKACRQISPNLSAGRVQSVALRLVVDREKEIRNFVPQEFWTMVASLTKGNSDVFKASLAKYKNKKIVPASKEEVDEILSKVSDGKYIVKNIKKSLSKQSPSAPYTTSTMQQDALAKIGSLKQVSKCAQELYEGVTLGSEGKVALITYIRTDSVRVAPEAQAMAREYISRVYGDKYVPKTPNMYKTKGSAQDAHEAIRPISLERTPEKVKEFLSSDNYKLYKLIYNRFLASQMTPATFDSVAVEIDNNDYTFKCTGKTPVFDGYTVLSQTTKKAKQPSEDDEAEGVNNKLPEMNEGDELTFKEMATNQKFTKPPSRYTEASLVKEMEEKGIGRPATYTPTITLLAARKYVDKEAKYLFPTELGEKLTDFLVKNYEGLFNVKFTADMENKLDQIANNEIDFLAVMKKFNDYLEKLLGQYLPPEKTGIMCEKCGHEMVKRVSKYGEFLACSNYPQCKHILNTNNPEEHIGQCPQCGSELVKKVSKYGEFIACSNYPTCKYIQGVDNVVGKCPQCGGDVLERKSRTGKIFYGCKNFPKCQFSSWEIPLETKCPKCDSYLTTKEINGNQRHKCSNPQCDFTEIVKKDSENV
ncbi:MAG: type I DNA topoisomerase [Clostridiales bacterium]|nr:type I DNA topoisomerase [Clostridiales bacterium]